VWLAVRRPRPKEASLGPSRASQSRGLRTNHPHPTPSLLNSALDDNISGQSRYTRAASSSLIFLVFWLAQTCMRSVVVIVLFVVILQTNTAVVPCSALLQVSHITSRTLPCLLPPASCRAHPIPYSYSTAYLVVYHLYCRLPCRTDVSRPL
jgi:hypothetical protein